MLTSIFILCVVGFGVAVIMYALVHTHPSGRA